MMLTRSFDNLLWTCAGCERWWLSQLLSPENWRLVKLTAVSQLSVEVSHAPAWLVSGPDPSVCPECGVMMKVQGDGRLQPSTLQVLQS